MLNESINKNYYSLQVIDLVTDDPLKFLRIFFKEFDKNIFTIDPSSKQEIYNYFSQALYEGFNKLTDSVNPFDMNLLTSSKEKMSIRLNFIGTNAKYKVYMGQNLIEEEMILKVSKMSVREFLKKFLEILKRFYIYRNKYTPNLGNQPVSKFGNDLNLTKFFLSLRIRKSIREKIEIKLLPTFSTLMPNTESYDLASLFPSSFQYKFQIDKFLQCEKYLVSYLNRHNYWIDNAALKDGNIVLFCSSSDSGKIQHKDYKPGTSHIQVQKVALDFLKLSLSSFKVENIENITDFKRKLFDILFNKS